MCTTTGTTGRKKTANRRRHAVGTNNGMPFKYTYIYIYVLYIRMRLTETRQVEANDRRETQWL